MLFELAGLQSQPVESQWRECIASELLYDLLNMKDFDAIRVVTDAMEEERCDESAAS